MSDKQDHLNENQLMQTIVDKTDLPDEWLAHLEVCADCRREKASVEKKLYQLHFLADQHLPVQKRNIRLPVRESAQSHSWFVGWQAAAGVAAVAVVFMFFISFWQGYTTQQHSAHHLVLETQDTDIIMAEVDLMVESALPEIYLDICGESVPGYDDQFMQFVVPDDEIQFLTTNI